MRIKKTFQGNLPENTVVNTQSNSRTNAYSCDFINQYIDGSHCEITRLLSTEIGAWSGATTTTANLSGNIGDYDMIVVTCRGDWNHINNLILLKGYIWTLGFHASADQGTYYVNGYVQFPTNTSIKVVWESGNWGINVWGVFGIKFK